MVQVHAAKPAFERPDPVRIAAMSGALSLNLAGLFLLLIPIVMPSAPPRVEDNDPQLIWPEIVEVKPIPPIPTPVLPVRQQVVHPVTPPTPIDTRPVFDEQLAVSDVVPPTIPVIDTATDIEPAGFVEGGALSVVVGTPPRYPIRALRAGIEGTVHLRILVGTDGLPIRVEVDRSSGNRELDSEAKRHVLKKWRFQPALRDGVPVEAWGVVPVVFTLARA